MHDVVDTEDLDAFSEHYWPDRFKEVIREKLSAAVKQVLESEDAFVALYEESYQRNFSTYQRLIQRIAEAAVIGAENGADDVFSEIDRAIDQKGKLPAPRIRPRPLLRVFDDALRNACAQAIFDEYFPDHFFEHEYGHCAGNIPDYPTFMHDIARLVTRGAVNGSDEMIASVYRSFYYRLPLPVARRYPKRLKHW